MTDHATLKARARAMRRQQAPTESELWRRLRMRQVRGVRFLRQVVVGNFIRDFYAPSLRLAIELDGGQHFEPTDAAYDAARSVWLGKRGVTVLRYTNLDVVRRMGDVLDDVAREILRLRADLLTPKACGQACDTHPPAAAQRPPSCRRG